MYDWESSLPNFNKDIREYLEKRYEDYCKDRNEGEEYGILKRHKSKKNELIKLGLVIREKFKYFDGEIRKELFEQMDLRDKHLDSFFKGKIDEVCNELKEEYKYKSIRQSDGYIFKERNKKLSLFTLKEHRKSVIFVEIIDEKIVEVKTKVLEYRKKQAEEKIVRERVERRQGLSNIKPLSFYEEKYAYNKDDEKYIDEDDSKSYIEEQQEIDRYFQETGTPKGEWIKNDAKEEIYFTMENNTVHKYPEIEIHVSVDSPEGNQKLLNRCKEMKEIIDDLLFQDYMQHFKWIQDENLFEVDVLQKYLTKGHLVTIQIAKLVFRIIFWLIWILSTDLNKPYFPIENHPAKEYKIDVYSDDFDIRKIREDVSEFVRVNEGRILTPLEYLKVYLKKHDNKITIKEYQLLEDKTNIVARRILNNFVKDKKLKCKKVGRGHTLTYSVR